MPNVGPLFERLVEIMAQLRGPNGCPWDKEQTPQSAVAYIIEEAHETVHAIESGTIADVKEELGDLLLQVVFQCQMVADTSGQFTIADVIDGITQKLIVRHPHVFGDTQVTNSDEVLVNWEKIKTTEKPGRHSILAGLPASLPSLLKAYRVGQKTSRVGFDWEDSDGILDKVAEEVRELHEAQTPAQKEDEFGDLLFTLANVGRFLKLDPEAALRKAITKFTARFQWVEDQAKKQGAQLQELSASEWDKLWNDSKSNL